VPEDVVGLQQSLAEDVVVGGALQLRFVQVDCQLYVVAEKTGHMDLVEERGGEALLEMGRFVVVAAVMSQQVLERYNCVVAVPYLVDLPLQLIVVDGKESGLVAEWVLPLGS